MAGWSPFGGAAAFDQMTMPVKEIAWSLTVSDMDGVVVVFEDFQRSLVAPSISKAQRLWAYLKLLKSIGIPTYSKWAYPKSLATCIKNLMGLITKKVKSSYRI